jgi:alpha-beta hydrolase superfamily lysophospholipase
MIAMAVLGMALAQVPMCWDGTIGEGARARRVIVESGPAEEVVAHVHGRPTRQVRLRALPVSAGAREHISDDSATSVVVQADGRARLRTMQGGVSVTALLERTGSEAPAAVLGTWNTRVGPGGVFRLIARVAAGPCAALAGVFDSPDQGQTDLPLTAASVRGDTVVLQAAYMDLRIALPARGGEERRGTMLQGGVVTEITLRRGVLDGRRPQEPMRPLPYVEREVKIASRVPGIDMTGTLTLPPTAGPHPVVVLISGSGAQDRDETVAGHRPFLVLSDRLTRLGYAVLRTDDRGVGGTGGNVLQSDLTDLAGDVRGAIDYLTGLPEIDDSRIGLLGHSEGGYIAPIVAAADSRVRFLILLGAPALTGHEVLVAQRAALTRAAGATEMEVRLDSLLIDRILSTLAHGPSDERIPQVVDSALSKWLQELPPQERAAVSAMLAARSAAADSQSVALWRSRWFKGLLAHDPRAFLTRTDVPVFALTGQLDLQVPFEPNARRFKSLYEDARAALLSLHTPAGVNHMLQPAVTGVMQEYAGIETTIAPLVLQLLETWITATIPVTARDAKRTS